MMRIAIAGAAHPHVAYATAEVDQSEALTLVAVSDPSRETAGSPVHGDYRMKLIGTGGTAELLWARNRLVLTTHEQAPYDVPLPAGHRPAELPLLALAAGNEPDITTDRSILATRLALLAQQSAETGGGPLTWTAT